MYIAIIGDIINSRNINERYKAQEQLQSGLKYINQKFSTSIASPFMITLGDEFQGLLHDADLLMDMLDTLRFKLWNIVDIRFGIGVGEIHTAIDSHSSLGADGPAYWSARSALEFIHDNNDYGNTKIRINFADPMDDLRLACLVNNTLRLCSLTEARWRASQLTFVQNYVMLQGYTDRISQKELAKQLNVSPQQVNQAIKLSGLYQYIDAKQGINYFVEFYLNADLNFVSRASGKKVCMISDGKRASYD